jgi:hypothetical protein
MAVETDVREETPGVDVDVTGGEFLLYRITVRGSIPIFDLEDSRVNKTLLSQDDEPISEDPLVYERKWPRLGETVATVSGHTLGMSFLLAIQYTYVVEHHHRDGSLIATLIDIDYISSQPEDRFFQRLGVNAS